MQQERKKKNQFLVRRRRKKRNKEKETEISLSLSLLQENFSEKGTPSIESSASPDDNASGSLFVPHCCCCRCMARLDDGCCFVFSLLILSKQLAVYSFFLFRFIGASICISLAIPFLSIDPGWLGEDRPAAAFTLQVNRLTILYSPDRAELTYRSAASSYCSPMYATWLRMLLINLIDVAVVTRGKSWIGQVTPYCGMRFSFSTASLFIALLSRQFLPF